MYNFIISLRQLGMFISVLILYVCVFTIVSACPPNSGKTKYIYNEMKIHILYYRNLFNSKWRV